MKIINENSVEPKEYSTYESGLEQGFDDAVRELQNALLGGGSNGDQNNEPKPETDKEKPIVPQNGQGESNDINDTDVSEMDADDASEEAQNAADRAQKEADKASNAAQSAKNAAENAQNTAEEIKSEFGEGSDEYKDAKELADEANESAKEAKKAAQEAQDAANTAQNAANKSKSAAQNGDAETAREEAKNAQNAAQDAKNAAQDAAMESWMSQDAAKESLEKYGSDSDNRDVSKMNAQDAASAAQNAANAAQDAANDAQDAANDAQELADEARDNARKAKSRFGEDSPKYKDAKNKADKAQELADETQKLADKAQDSANSAQEAADKAFEASENGDANKARREAQKARDENENAQQSADDAVNSADNAMSDFSNNQQGNQQGSQQGNQQGDQQGGQGDQQNKEGNRDGNRTNGGSSGNSKNYGEKGLGAGGGGKINRSAARKNKNQKRKELRPQVRGDYKFKPTAVGKIVKQSEVKEKLKGALKNSGFSDKEIEETLTEVASKNVISREEVKNLRNNIIRQKPKSAIGKICRRIKMNDVTIHKMWDEIVKIFLEANTIYANRKHKLKDNTRTRWGDKRVLAHDLMRPYHPKGDAAPQNINVFVDTSGSVNLDVVELFADTLVNCCAKLQYSGITLIPFADTIDLKSGIYMVADEVKKNKEAAMKLVIEMATNNDAGGGTEVKDCVDYILKTRQSDRNSVWLFLTDGGFWDVTPLKKLLPMKNKIMFVIYEHDIKEQLLGYLSWCIEPDYDQLKKCYIELNDTEK